MKSGNNVLNPNSLLFTGIVFLKEEELIFDAEKQELKHRESGELLKIFDALLVRIEADHSNDFR